jgi:hypothetical protein
MNRDDAYGIAAPAVVMTTEVAVVAPHVAVKPAMLLPPAATTGATDGMKKPEGYVSVMVPPGAIPPKRLVRKPIVTGTSLFKSMKSDGRIKNRTDSGLLESPTMRPKGKQNTTRFMVIMMRDRLALRSCFFASFVDVSFSIDSPHTLHAKIKNINKGQTPKIIIVACILYGSQRFV